MPLPVTLPQTGTLSSGVLRKSSFLAPTVPAHSQADHPDGEPCPAMRAWLIWEMREDNRVDYCLWLDAAGAPRGPWKSRVIDAMGQLGQVAPFLPAFDPQTSRLEAVWRYREEGDGGKLMTLGLHFKQAGERRGPPSGVMSVVDWKTARQMALESEPEFDPEILKLSKEREVAAKTKQAPRQQGTEASSRSKTNQPRTAAEMQKAADILGVGGKTSKKAPARGAGKPNPKAKDGPAGDPRAKAKPDTKAEADDLGPASISRLKALRKAIVVAEGQIEEMRPKRTAAAKQLTEREKACADAVEVKDVDEKALPGLERDRVRSKKKLSEIDEDLWGERQQRRKSTTEFFDVFDRLVEGDDLFEAARKAKK